MSHPLHPLWLLSQHLELVSCGANTWNCHHLSLDHYPFTSDLACCGSFNCSRAAMICTFVLSLNPAFSSCRWDLLTSASSSVWRWYMAFRGQSCSSPTGFLLLEGFTSHLSTEGHLPDALTDHHSVILDSGSEPPLVSGYSLAALDLRWNPPCYYIISYTFLFLFLFIHISNQHTDQ